MVERILMLISENSMTSKEFTDKLSLNSATVSEWKKGKIKPTVDVLIRISAMFNVSLDWLMTGEGEKYKLQPTDELPISAPNAEPPKKQVYFTVRGYGGKNETRVISEEDYAKMKPLVDDLFDMFEKKRDKLNKRKR